MKKLQFLAMGVFSSVHYKDHESKTLKKIILTFLFLNFWLQDSFNLNIPFLRTELKDMMIFFPKR